MGWGLLPLGGMGRGLLLFFAFFAMTAQAQTKLWNHVVTGYANTPVVKVTSVALYADRTEVGIHLDVPKGQPVGFMPGTSLKTGDKEYMVRDATVIRLGEPYTMPADTLSLTLSFAPLPAATKRFDFVSPDGLQLLNIRSADEMPEGIADTYWRSEATGEWLIGFAPKHVIYDHHVCDIVSQTEKKDFYTLTLNDGTTIRVGKMKKGVRDITIGNRKPVACSPVTTATLPDYPTKDTRKGFIDNGYSLTDSVTVIGWLKDMPEQAWKKGKEFEINCNDIISGKQESAFAKMDTLGRFTLRMPLLNSSQVFLDWRRTTKSSVLEPGKTYFFLYDFKTGQMLWMGDDVRVQNELLTYPHAWPNERIGHEEAGEISAMQFKVQTDNTRAANMAELNERVKRHPTLSQRYIDYVEGYYQTAQGESMMQASFDIPGRQLPQEYMDYAGKEVWQKAVKPYTLYRDFGTFMRDYLDLMQGAHHANRGEETVAAIRRLEQQGVVTLSTDENDALMAYAEKINNLENDLQNAHDSEKIDSLVNAFNSDDTVNKVYTLFDRIGDPIKNELATSVLRENLAVIDSVGCDADMRDIFIARYLYRQIDVTRQPLEPALMAYAEKNVRMPAALMTIKAMNDKYLAIMQRDITNSNQLKSNNVVADMSDGEQILRKITEPYRGRLILLDIWGTWCGPCKEALAHSQEEYVRLKDFDIVYLYLANRSNDESWKSVIKEYGVMGDNVVHYNLPFDQQDAIEHFLQVHAFPTYKLIDRNGNVLDVNADPHDLEGLANLLEKF